MADILSDGTRPEQLLQVIHSRTARTFDEGQDFITNTHGKTLPHDAG